MSLVPALDLRPPQDEPQHLPANVEAEQALLGALLYDNSAYERLDDILKAEHFFEPFHQRLFAAIETNIRKGMLAEPILLANDFQRDPGFSELGGVRYLAALVDRAPPAPNARDYAKVVHERFLDRQLLEISRESIRSVEDGEGEDARERIEAAEHRLFHLAENRTGGGVITFGDALVGAVDMATQAFNRDGGLSGLSTGLIDLDHKAGGLHPSDLIVLAARPSMGKTSLATNIAYDVARRYRYEVMPDGSHRTVDGGRVLFFSLEMSAEQLAMRVAAAAAGVSGDKLRKGMIDATEFGQFRDAAIELSEIPLHIDATGGLALPKMFARARRQKRRTGLDLIVVDYLQLVDSGLRGDTGRVQQLTAITTGLKALAKELGVPVLALSQLSRQVENREDKKPQLSDLRESGSIEQDADMVMFIYREEYYLERLEPRSGTEEHFKWQEQMDAVRGLADIIIGKARHGPIGTVPVTFNPELTKFGNLARDPQRYGRNPAGND